MSRCEACGDRGLALSRLATFDIGPDGTKSEPHFYTYASACRCPAGARYRDVVVVCDGRQYTFAKGADRV